MKDSLDDTNNDDIYLPTYLSIYTHVYRYIHISDCFDFRILYVCIGRLKCGHHLEDLDVSGRINHHIP
jgi:hypothetical protein